MSNTTTLNSELIQKIQMDSELALYETSVARAVSTVYDFEVGSGLQVNVPIWGRVSASKPGEGTPPAKGDTDTAGKTITMVEHVAYNQITDLLRDSTNDNIIAKLSQSMGLALAESLDQELISLFASNDITQSFGSAGTENTINDIMKAAARIRSNRYSGPLFAILNPMQAYAIKAALTASGNAAAAGMVADDVLMNYFVGRMAGVTILEHAGVAVDANSDTVGCVFAPAAFGVAQRGGVFVEPDRQAKERATDLVATVVAGAGILRPELAVKIVGDAAL